MPEEQSGRSQYYITSFVHYRPLLDLLALPHENGGHYVAFVKKDSSWFELDAALLTKLAHSPTAFPSLIFLEARGHEDKAGFADEVLRSSTSHQQCTLKRSRTPSSHIWSTSLQNQNYRGNPVHNTRE